MGLYINVPEPRGKLGQITTMYAGEMAVPPPTSFEEIPPGKALIVIVDNIAFEAAGWIDTEEEFERFHEPTDTRVRSYLYLDHATACKLTEHRSPTCRCNQKGGEEDGENDRDRSTP